MIHRNTQLRFISEEIGHGVVATEAIPVGTIVWVRDQLDREFTPEQLAQIAAPCRAVLDTYSYRNRHGNYFLCWDHTRFINHSFNANCLPTAYGFELAIRDIAPGEEITNDYGALNIIESFEAVDEGHDRNIVHPDDLLRYHPEWDEKLRAAFARLPHVPQPLRELLSDEQWEACLRIASGAEPMQSIRLCYFNPA